LCALIAKSHGSKGVKIGDFMPEFGKRVGLTPDQLHNQWLAIVARYNASRKRNGQSVDRQPESHPDSEHQGA